MNTIQHDRIIKAKVKLNKSNPFFSHILMSMNIERTESNENIPTMGVNAFGDLYWNEDFVSKIPDAELHAVLCHEAMHVATLTFAREGKRDHMLWNIATDLVINNMLLEDGFTLPKDCLLTVDGKYTLKSATAKKNVKIEVAGKTAEEVYDELMKHVEIIHMMAEGGEGEGGEGDKDGNFPGQFDSHLPGDKDSKGKDQGKNDRESDGRANEEKWKKAAVEAATAAKMRGNLSNGLERELNGILAPKIDWRKKLNQYITQEIPVDFSMRRPGRRFYSTGIYTPEVVRENLEVIVGIDVSGSISGEEMNDFMAEVIGIAEGFQQVKMRVIFWSTLVDPKDDVEVNSSNKDRLMTLKSHSSGGTEMSCFAKHCQKMGYNSRIYVILTDGYVEDNPELPNGNVLFVLSKNGSDAIVKKCGDVTSLKDMDRD
jgi:predicted metal-dependent peptidase